MPNQVSQPQTNRTGKPNVDGKSGNKNQKQIDDLNLGDRQGTGQRGDTVQAEEYKKDGFSQKTGNVDGNRVKQNQADQPDQDGFTKKSGAQ